VRRYRREQIASVCRDLPLWRGGIKPVKSAAKALYAFNPCYEGSPSRPRGAIVGGRRFA